MCPCVRADAPPCVCVRAQDELEFHVGFRRFTARPVFSQNNIGGDKHKFERFLPTGAWTVASVLGPIAYTPSPVMVYKRVPDPADPSKVCTHTPCPRCRSTLRARG